MSSIHPIDELIDEYGRTPLFSAVQSGDVDLVRSLLEEGSNPDTPRTDNPDSPKWWHAKLYGTKDDTSPLMIAAKSGQNQIIKMLLNYGANVNYRRSHVDGRVDDFSALDLVVDRRDNWNAVNWETARLLVEAGADLGPPSMRQGEPHNLPPLMWVALEGPSELAKLMLKKGADSNHVTTFHSGIEFYESPIHFALARSPQKPETTAIIKILCEAGADLNIVSPTRDSRTPLHTAVRCCFLPSILSTLVMAGADPFGLNETGLTVVEEVALFRDPDVLLDSRPSHFDSL